MKTTLWSGLGLSGLGRPSSGRSGAAVAGCLLLAGLSLAGLSLGGCASTDYVDQRIAAVQSDVNALKGQVAGIHGQLKDDSDSLAMLNQKTSEAIDKAEAASKAPAGKFAYSMVLTDKVAKFASNRRSLSPEAQTKLTEFADKLKADDKSVYIEIQGNTDSQGASAANYRVGAARADAVRRFLAMKGVPLTRMSTISYGADNPAATNKTAEGRALNRRVVLVVLQ